MLLHCSDSHFSLYRTSLYSKIDRVIHIKTIWSDGKRKDTFLVVSGCLLLLKNLQPKRKGSNVLHLQT